MGEIAKPIGTLQKNDKIWEGEIFVSRTLTAFVEREEEALYISYALCNGTTYCTQSIYCNTSSPLTDGHIVKKKENWYLHGMLACMAVTCAFSNGFIDFVL